MSGFRKFLLRGNLIDLAVAVVIGTAFAAVVKAFVEDLITPLIAAMGGKKDFAAEHFTVNHSIFKTGDFLNALFAFVLVAAVLYFLVVKPFSALLEQVKDDEAPAAATVRDCPHCVSSVPIKATVCAYCTRDLPALEVDA